MTLEMKIKEERENAKIENTIELLTEFQWSKEEIIHKLQNKFSLSEQEALEHFSIFCAERK